MADSLFENGERRGNGGHAAGNVYRHATGLHANTMRDVVAVIFRHSRLVLLSFAGIFLGVILVAVFVVSNHYQAHMKIMVKHERADPIVTPEATNQLQLATDSVSETELNSEVELLKSRDLLEKVVLETGLDKGKSLRERLLPFWKLDPRVHLAKAVSRLAGNLRIEPLKNTNLIDVSYASSNPVQAARVLNVLTREYLQKHLAVHRPAGALDFFVQQTEHYRQSLQQAEEKLSSYSKQADSVSAPMARDLTVQKMADFNATLRTTETQISETERRIHDLETQLAQTPERISTVEHSTDSFTLLEQLKGTLLTLQLKRTDLLTKYDPSYPLVKEVDAQIAQTESAIADAEKSPTKDISTDRDPTHELLREDLAKAQADLAMLKGRKAATQEAIRQYEQSALQLDGKATAQQDLQREAKADEDNYLLYLHKQEEARISDALDNSRIVNVAVAEAPVVPALPVTSPLLVILLGAVMAGVISVVLAFALEYFSRSFRTPDEVVEILELPVYASIPKTGS